MVGHLVFLFPSQHQVPSPRPVPLGFPMHCSYGVFIPVRHIPWWHHGFHQLPSVHPGALVQLQTPPVPLSPASHTVATTHEYKISRSYTWSIHTQFTRGSLVCTGLIIKKVIPWQTPELQNGLGGWQSTFSRQTSGNEIYVNVNF